MKESYFQTKLKEDLENEGYLVWIISDRFTKGIPDVYAAKDGEEYWLELKVINKTGKIHLADWEASAHRFTKAQAIKLYQLQQKGVNAFGVCYLAPDKKIITVQPEEMENTLDYSELKEYPEFTLLE